MEQFFYTESKQKTAFSLIELIVIIGILAMLMVVAIPAFRIFQRESNLAGEAEEVASALRLAQSKTLASEGASQYGVYFNTSSVPHSYTLFKGQSYASRDLSFDKIYNLSNISEIYEADLWGGKEVVFKKITGYASSASSFGRVSMRLTTDISETKTIYIENSGLVNFIAPLSPSNGRLTDSRHIHFDYDRTISTATESVILDFSTTQKEIVLAVNLEDGQIFWEGDVDVNGENQHIKIHTHRINSPDTQFSVHRDRRYNNKALTVTISGDASGSLISYTDAGQESRGTSVNLTIGQLGNPQRQ